ncbi:MAG: fumarylacetoacetate hydrolase family protein [Bacteroidetes bacterium]|nr:fumarylacetoacetate hydrolase family protein [Bacteroidota bacterium]
MRLYHTKAGIVAEKNNDYYLLREEWDTFINDDELLTKTELRIKGLTPGSSELIHELLPPIGSKQELWACGVTYFRSKQGRQEESKDAGSADFYAKVYDAERPEVFFKANAHRVVGHGDLVRIRKDSTWDVPEPELTLVVASSGKIIGYTIGNDMSSRSIEGENPLYLPQAKTYDGCAAIGPCIYLTNETIAAETVIELWVIRNRLSIFEGTTTLQQMKRKLDELVAYVYRACSFPEGCLIMTGTGIVPGADFTLQSGDEIHIRMEPIGQLTNTVA